MLDGSNYGSGDISKILAERGRTHGDFKDHARITTMLKDVITGEMVARDIRGQPIIPAVAREALDMIAHKIGRILAGRWDHPDHWDDIAGYAKLVSQACTPGPHVTALSSTMDATHCAGIKIAWETTVAGDDPGDMG